MCCPNCGCKMQGEMSSLVAVTLPSSDKKLWFNGDQTVCFTSPDTVTAETAVFIMNPYPVEAAIASACDCQWMLINNEWRQVHTAECYRQNFNGTL